MSRPYRSKRQRPCDQCRERKLGCQTEPGLPCARCRSADLRCTFAKPPPRRPRRQREDGHHENGSEMHIHESIEPIDSSQLSVHPSIEPEHHQPLSHPPSQASHPPSHSSHPPVVTDPVLNSPWAQQLISSGRAPTQFVQSLDHLEGFSAQLFGTSAESDPWLLRHCSFDDAGVKGFYKVHYRNAGGVPTPLKIPVHFMIAADDLSAGAKLETCVAAGRPSREELNCLVPPDYGQRLIGLYATFTSYGKLYGKLIDEQIHQIRLSCSATGLALSTGLDPDMSHSGCFRAGPDPRPPAGRHLCIGPALLCA